MRTYLWIENTPLQAVLTVAAATTKLCVRFQSQTGSFDAGQRWTIQYRRGSTRRTRIGI